MQMTAAQMQHQQLIRSQNGGIAGTGMANSTQMQQLLTQQHQQQTLAMQQNNNQMSLQMQMSQSTSVNSVNVAGTGKWPAKCLEYTGNEDVTTHSGANNYRSYGIVGLSVPRASVGDRSTHLIGLDELCV